MDSAQEAASPPDQSQPATDPLALEQPDQPETASIISEPVSTTEPPSTEAQPHSDSSTEQQSTLPEPQSQTLTAVPPFEPSSSEMVTVNTLDNAIKSPTQEPAVDPLASSEPQPEEHPPMEPANSQTPPEEEPPKEDKPDPSTQESTGGVTSSNMSDPIQPSPICEENPSVDSQPTSSDKPTSSAAGQSAEIPSDAANEIPISSSSSMNSFTGSNGSSTSNSINNTTNVGIRNAVSSDNSLKINGISDLSILDVTQGNDDEIEVKVEGGSLMHKVIKFSLLNGMQDSSKRLENSRLIMSGVGSNPTIEKTLATTSSLGRTALGGGPLRQNDKAKEEGFKGGGADSFDASKTTPPACSSARPTSAEPSLSSSNSNSSDSGSNANNSDSSESKPNRTEEPSERVRHSADSHVSSGAGAENVREESVSDTYSKSVSLDFREWPKTSSSSAMPASTSDATATAVSTVSTANSSEQSTVNQETDQSENAVPAIKRTKAMYYAEMPDFSKPVCSTSSLTTATPSATSLGSDRSSSGPSKTLSQLQMKTPDFSRIIGSPPSANANQPNPNLAAPTPVSTNSLRSHELQIANPDFSKSFAPKAQQSTPFTTSASSTRRDEHATYMNPTSFAEISKQRNYISDLQLKNPTIPESGNTHSSIVKAPPGPSSIANYRIDQKPSAPPKPYPPSMYRHDHPAAPVQLEEPKAHVIHKAPSNPEGSRPWNPITDYSSKSYSQPNERDRYFQQYPTGHKGPPPLSSEPHPPAPQTYARYPPYPPKKSTDPPPVSAAHPGGIIVKTYYPEQHQPQQQQPQQPILPTSKELEFRLEQKEKQLRQEGTIITLKPNDNRPPDSNRHQQPAQSAPYPPPQSYHVPQARSPSTERRNETQEILYRDFKLKQSYEMPQQSSIRGPPSRPQEEPRARPHQEQAIPRDRSPYDTYYRGAPHPSSGPPPSKYYPPTEHHKTSVSPALSATPSPTPLHAQNRSPVPIPTNSKHVQPGPSGMMHPPSNWPNQSRAIPSPHGSATSSPLSAPPSVSPSNFTHQKNSPSPVHSFGPQAGPSHGVYKSPSPSPSSSSSPYGGGPTPHGAPAAKYTQYYPTGNGERVVSIEINKETFKPGLKELDFNMEQKFAEVYQAHQLKEKQQAAAASKIVEPHRSQTYPAGAAAEYPYQTKPPAERRPQEPYREEYRPQTISPSAPHPQSSRYVPQENLNHYGQYYQQRAGPDMEARKPDPQVYKAPSRDPSPGQRYGSNEQFYHHSKHAAYPPSQPSSSKGPPQHAMYPPSGSEPTAPSSLYGPPGKNIYPSSPYERPPEKPSVISNAYSQDRARSRTAYPESRQPVPSDGYPPAGHPYQPTAPQAKSTSTNSYPHHVGQQTLPSSSRDTRDPAAWHYQQQAPAPTPPGPSGYNHDRHPTVVRDERQNPVIQPPVNKNIPVKVIATANPPPPAAPSSTTIAPATSTTKRESPLDLSVKTVKTKADSTGCDDYGHSSRGRDVLPKVNFNPNFKKHIPSIPERPAKDTRAPQPVQPSQPYNSHMAREPQVIPQHQPQLAQQGTASRSSQGHSDYRSMPAMGSVIPPGYDKKTDAYMSANYRAVGGPAEMRDTRYVQDNHYPPQQGMRPVLPDHRDQPAPYRGPPGPHAQRGPHGAPTPPYQYQSMPPKSEPYYTSGSKPGGPSASSRSVYYPPQELARGSKHLPGVQKLSMDDPRIEDRKFVESMLKKQASPSAEVIADLQAGKFSTRIPSALAPAKKRPAEAIPKTSPPKVPRVEEPNLHRPYENSYRYPPHPGPAAPRDYYPVPIKHEPASPQPAGIYYADKRSEAPSITRGVLNTPPSSMSHSVLQPTVPQNTRPIDSHTSVITSYHAPGSKHQHPRAQEESPQQKDFRVHQQQQQQQHQQLATPSQQPTPHNKSYGQPDERVFYSTPEPFRHGHGDSKFFGSSLEKPSSHSMNHTEANVNHLQQPSTIVMQSHIQYGGQLPPQSAAAPHYKRPGVVQSPPRSDYYSSANHTARAPSIVENYQSKSIENVLPPKTTPEERPTPTQVVHSNHEPVSQASPAPSPQHRGVDQSVISKLRTSLEQKERFNQLRKQTSSEMSEEDSKPPEVNSFPPSHFRSKGAMKAFTPIPNFDIPNSTPQSAQQPPPPKVDSPRPPSPIKSEPVEMPKEPIEPPAEIEGASALDILDWGSACNEFVEQLQTGKKRGRRKRGSAIKHEPDQPDDEDGFKNDLPGINNSALSEVPQEVLKSAKLEIRDQGSSSDEDKPLHLLKIHNSSTGEQKDEQMHAIRNSTMEKLSEKIARNMREKQRLEQEQKHEAKLGYGSSSEDESGTKRLIQRSKLRARKLRNRSSVPLKSSDVNTDEEDEEDEDDQQARDLRKRKHEENTTSESEAGSNVKKMNRCQTQVKQENESDLSSDEEDPKSGTPGKKDASKTDVKIEDAKQTTHSDSESNAVKVKDTVKDKKNCVADEASSGNESEREGKSSKKSGSKKPTKSRTTSKSRVVDEESSESEEETMTRSRSKLELEKRRSNSKVLRNDKIVGNFVRERKKSENVTPQKGRKGQVNAKLEASKKRILDSDSDSKTASGRKRTRKTSKLQTTSASESSEESDVETVSERLRSRKSKYSETSAPSSASKRGNSQDNRTPSKTVEKKCPKAEQPKRRGRQQKKTSQDCASENTSENFYPGWEKELYEFKRSLKVPPELITIGGRRYLHRISTSLPDLESHHSDESETFSEIVKKINQNEASSGKKIKTKAAAKQCQKNNQMSKEQQAEEKKIDANKKFTSITEILHERMLRHVKLAKARKSKGKDDKEVVKPKQEYELLPTPGAESEALFNRKKKSLFDTAIFKSRTRTEQKVMQSKEIIREVFGGDDERPQSAPPLACIQEIKNVTYDEMYNQMLTKSHDVATFLAQKKVQDAVASTSGTCGSAVKIKLEDLDDETQDSVLKDSERITEEGDTPSVVSERDLATPLSFRGSVKKKSHKSRRKGSSGFDYIRKKKKPVVNNGENSVPTIPKKKVVSVFDNLETKDESHINKEIRSWVLNKGVGESVMHKAARLGYTDVIVYCLERLEMDPDLKDNAGYTPLHEACAKGHLDICHYLLQYGASHSETALAGIRPLHEAVENSFIEVVRLLLAFGADPMLATYAGQTPIQLAENNEMALFLENHLYDIQSTSPTKTGWKLDGPWKIHDPEESGCDIMADIPGFSDDDNLHNHSNTTERSMMSNSTYSTDTLDGSKAPSICLPPPPPPLPPPAVPLPLVQQPNPKKCDSNSNIMNFEVKMEQELKYKDCAVVLNDIQDQNEASCNNGSSTIVENGQLRASPASVDVKSDPLENGVPQTNGFRSFEDSDEEGNDDNDGGEDDDDEGDFVFEYEEAERPLPPLYLLKDEAAGDKWVLMTDLCNFLKLKSKEAVLKQICSNNSTPITPNTQSNNSINNAVATNLATNGANGTTREMIRELKLDDFLSRSSCLQLLYAGEKLNINSNKVMLVKYNEKVRNLLQVQTVVAKI